MTHATDNTTGRNGDPVVIWCLSDGRPGHRRQIEGLMSRLSELRTIDAHWLSVEDVGHVTALADTARARFTPGDDLPNPDLIIGAGHRTHLPALAARRARGGRSIVLMRPTLPAALFDLCLIPEHDTYSPLSQLTRFGSIVTRGVLNPFTASSAADSTCGLMLIGGPSRHHGWSDERMVEQLAEIRRLSPTRVQWTLTTSRRTPTAFVEQANARLTTADNVPPVNIVPFDETGPGWLSEQLTASRTVFVSEDSVSMVYESLTVGADVGILDVPRLRRRSRNAQCIDHLLADELVVAFENWRESRFERRQRIPFNEAARCADIVCERLLDAA